MNEDYDYPENFLFIKQTVRHGQGIIFLTEPYEVRLSEYIERKVRID